MKKIIVLDVSSGDTHIFSYDEERYEEEDIDIMFDAFNEAFDLDLKTSECSWMFVDTVNILVH